MLEQDLAGVIRFRICVKWYQSFGYFLMIEEDNNGLKYFSTMMGIVEEEINATKSTLNNMVQELKRLSLKIDDQV